jgi:hypothetical protein
MAAVNRGIYKHAHWVTPFREKHQVVEHGEDVKSWLVKKVARRRVRMSQREEYPTVAHLVDDHCDREPTVRQRP